MKVVCEKDRFKSGSSPKEEANNSGQQEEEASNSNLWSQVSVYLIHTLLQLENKKTKTNAHSLVIQDHNICFQFLIASAFEQDAPQNTDIYCSVGKVSKIERHQCDITMLLIQGYRIPYISIENETFCNVVNQSVFVSQ